MKPKITKQEFALLLFSIIFTLLVALILIRLIAPGLLGVPADLVLVKSSNEVVPYYEQIFNKEDISSAAFLLDDPYVKERAKQLYPNMGRMGPHDILGFRNIAVPNHADIVIIGDSQTYGNNVWMWMNWPHQIQVQLPVGKTVYSMATGGWATVQYFYTFAKSLVLKPEIIIVAFYTGNDPVETYTMVQATNLWNEFIPPGLNLDDMELPSANFPAPANERWEVTFDDGFKTVFTPKLRHISNMQIPSIDTAYQIMFNMAKRMGEIATSEGIKLVFTIIPTKEFVYALKLENSNLTIDEDYQALVQDEAERIKVFSEQLSSIQNAKYVDVSTALQKKALTSIPLYLPNQNGHPISPGYQVIGNTIFQHIKEQLDFSSKDGFSIADSGDDLLPIFISNGNFWIVVGDTNDMLDRQDINRFGMDDLNKLSFKGYIEIDYLQKNNLL